MNISFFNNNTSFGKIKRNPGTQKPIMTGTDYSDYKTNNNPEKKSNINTENTQAKQIIVESYIPLALAKATEFSKKEPDIDANEVVQTTMLATVEAVSSYSPKKDKNLSKKIETEIDTAFDALKAIKRNNSTEISLQEILNMKFE